MYNIVNTKNILLIPYQVVSSVLSRVNDLVQNLFKKSQNECCKKLFSAMITIPTKDKESFARQTSSLLSENTSFSNKVKILYTLYKTLSENRKILVEQSLRLISYTTSEEDKMEIFRLLSTNFLANNSLPFVSHDIMLERLLRLISPEMLGSEKVNILRNVAVIPNEDREAIIDLVCEISATMSLRDSEVRDRIDILRTLVSYPREERESITRQSFLLISPEMVGSKKVNIFRNVAAIPNEDREAIIDLVFEISGITSFRDFEVSDRIDILRTLLSYPREERESIARQSLRLLSPTMSSAEKLRILRNVADIPNEDREAIIDQIFEIFETISSSDFEDRIDILSIFVYYPREERESILRHSLRLLSPRMSSVEILTLVMFIANTPNERREAINHNQITLNHNQITFIPNNSTRFYVESNQINENPIEVMTNLFDMINSNQISLLPSYIKYIDSNGIDAGGITRSFITDLVNAFSKSDTLVTEQENLGVVPLMRKDGSSLSIEDQKKCFKIIGRFFSAAIQNYKSVVIGKHFHPSVFEMIFSLNEDDFKEENSIKTFNKLFSMYLKKELKLKEEDIKNILENNLSQEFKEDYFVESIDDIYEYKQIDKQIDAILIIAKSMYASLTNQRSWDSLKGDSVEVFQKKIEGNLSREAVVNAFKRRDVLNSVDDQMKIDYIKRWSESVSLELLEKFVKAISGNICLTPNTQFTITPMNGENRLPCFHTCSMSIELSKYSSYEEFKQKLELSLTYCFTENGFQFA